jgi:hypothetical protein
MLLPSKWWRMQNNALESANSAKISSHKILQGRKSEKQLSLLASRTVGPVYFQGTFAELAEFNFHA